MKHQPSPDPRRWVRAHELAEITGLSLATVRKLSMYESCPVIRPEFCRCTLFDVEQFKGWLASRSRQNSQHREAA